MTVALLEPRAFTARWLGVLLAWLCMTPPTALAAEACTLQPLAIQPATGEPADTYIGRTAALELRFHNDKTHGTVDVFPEPPLTLKRLDTQAECAVREGGVWVRRHVWTSADGGTLVTHEYSGSNDELVFYDTLSCARTAVIDVSNKRWSIEGSAVLKSSAKAGKRQSWVQLAPSCRPVRTAAT